MLIGDVSGKGRENAGLSAMVRFFVEARTWDCDSPGRGAGADERSWSPRARGPETFVPVFLAFVEGDRIRWSNGGHMPPRLLGAAGGELELGNTGLPLGVEDDARYGEQEAPFAGDDLLFAFTDGLSEARHDGELFGDARLDDLLAEHARALDPEALGPPPAPPGRGVLAVAAGRRRDPRAAPRDARAVAMEIRHEVTRLGGRAALFARYMELVRDRLGPDFAPTETIFASEEVFAGPGADWVVLYEGGRPVGCGGLRMLEPGVAEIKRMFVVETARGRGHGRRLLAELERSALANGAERVRLLSTEVLAEARALYQSAGYDVISTYREDGRQDYWLEKRLVALSTFHPKSATADHRHAASSDRARPPALHRSCVLAWRRRRPLFRVERHEKNH